VGENLCQNLVVLETLAVAGNLALQREEELASSAKSRNQRYLRGPPAAANPGGGANPAVNVI
jgi:hypothetical protein